ncbi:TetR/AcrR family transcriptional regulator [Streptomyces sp. RFCAC02]|uniref:TetR/AcrR family transcriptional regulator n=1 Tax=Streptomyces sp. RFCAC02 TaxID=2499143 RepID=UPI00101F30FE|nr:TetR/AcrR family transcriptional regulator [Streptomyces sp. RFCAC02]
MSPRHSAAEANRTRDRIIERSVDLASLEGLEGLTIGRLATDLGMSKSGVLGHFGTKEALQVAAMRRAAEVFDREVWRPAVAAAPGLPRLRAVCAAWISYLERDVFPGGCLFVSVTFEYDGRTGPVHALIKRQFHVWALRLTAEIRRAVHAGDLPAGTDPAQLVFELYGVMMSLNHTIQLNGDRAAAARAHRATDRLLGFAPAGTPLAGAAPAQG